MSRESIATEAVNISDKAEMTADSLENCRAALKKYAEFIKSLVKDK